MDELDRKIEEVMSEEGRAVVAQFGAQGIFGQWFGIYDGAVRGVAIFATVLIFALAVAAVYCGWRLFGAGDGIEAARWGAGTVLLLVMVGFLKLWFWMRMESNRVLREIKRLELRLALMQRK
jgi:hypothetical protein